MKARLVACLGASYLRFVGATSEIVWVHRDRRNRLEASGQGFIYASWHGRQAFLPWLHRGDRLHPLVSQSADGEIIARVCRSFGMQPIRGSSSRGGAEALLKIRRSLEAGDRVGFTPDGPKGPLHSIQPGVLFTARKTGAVILPVACGARSRWTFGSWDRFELPKPFNRIAMVYGEPIGVGAADDLAMRAEDLRRALLQVSAEADTVAQGIA
jgi:lysophospholipid acyltransferase (LPLAT)-like uncharacterized protein